MLLVACLASSFTDPFAQAAPYNTPHSHELPESDCDCSESVSELEHSQLAPASQYSDPNFTDANWVSMGPLSGVNGSVYTSTADAAGNLYIGGQFTAVGDILATNVAKWDGSQWTAMGTELTASPGMFGDPRGSVNALAVFRGEVYAGGRFERHSGYFSLAKWDGAKWVPVTEVNIDEVYALTVSGTNLYAGGWSSFLLHPERCNACQFRCSHSGDWENISACYDGCPCAERAAANYVSRWDGTTWTSLAMNTDRSSSASVRALTVLNDDLYAGGRFNALGGSAAKNIARWDGTNWFALRTGINDEVKALAVFAGELYAGGNFRTEAGTPAGFAKWNGSNWIMIASEPVHTVAAMATTKTGIYMGGASVTAKPDNFAKWDGQSWTPLPGVSGQVNTLTVAGLGIRTRMYVGGSFATAGSSLAGGIAEWNGTDWMPLTAAKLPPELSIDRVRRGIALSWLSDGSEDFVLEEAAHATLPMSWLTTAESISNDGSKKSITISPGHQNRFFRLRKSLNPQ